jgi:hypothetical protein
MENTGGNSNQSGRKKKIFLYVVAPAEHCPEHFHATSTASGFFKIYL